LYLLYLSMLGLLIRFDFDAKVIVRKKGYAK
jgi:hypothetical protein